MKLAEPCPNFSYATYFRRFIMKSMALIKRKTFSALAALMLAVSALSVLPVTDAAAAGTIRIMQSADGKVVLICHYSARGVLQYCDIASPR
jgi:hypothetical protein